MAVGGWVADVDGVYETYPDLYLPVHGRFQTRNLAVAVAAVEELFGRPIGEEPLRAGVAHASSPGRLEVIGRRPLLIVDGSHNDEGMAVLSEALKEEFLPTRWVVVLGVLGDKDLEEMLRRLNGIIDAVVATAADSDRAVAPEVIAKAAQNELGPAVPVEAVPVVADAVRRAVELAGDTGGVVVTGSLYVAGEARPVAKEMVANR
jgi:dihydrofolate synthase/folylpolyglutamate synthase